MLADDVSHSAQIAAEQEAARDAGEEDEGPLEVEGFLFKRLLERKPEKKQELLTLRDHLLATSSSSDTLKACSLCPCAWPCLPFVRRVGLLMSAQGVRSC